MSTLRGSPHSRPKLHSSARRSTRRLRSWSSTGIGRELERTSPSRFRPSSWKSPARRSPPIKSRGPLQSDTKGCICDTQQAVRSSTTTSSTTAHTPRWESGTGPGPPIPATGTEALLRPRSRQIWDGNGARPRVDNPRRVPSSPHCRSVAEWAHAKLCSPSSPGKKGPRSQQPPSAASFGSFGRKCACAGPRPRPGLPSAAC
jgi:hypothetical protein